MSHKRHALHVAGLMLLLLHPLSVTAIVPNWEQTWRLPASTVLMPCNWTGFLQESAYRNWGLVDIDWSNARAVWSSAEPMTCQETLLQQARAVKAATPGAKVMVYRNLVKALPWYSAVREKIRDPAYSGWFLKFSDAVRANHSAAHVPVCTGTKCSLLYHDQWQTPGPAEAGTCLNGPCDCGDGIPCGEYLWDHRNQSLRDWLLNEFVLGDAALGSPDVDGFYFDDSWKTAPSPLPPTPAKPWVSCDRSPVGGASEEHPYCALDMGLNAQDVSNIAGNWTLTAAMAEQAVLKHGGFTWGASSLFVGTGARVAAMDKSGLGQVWRDTCAQDLRARCVPNDPWAAGALLHELTRKTFTDPFPLPYVEQDVASFLLLRGPYAWIGHNWMGCPAITQNAASLRPAQLDVDMVGEPVDANCHETEPNSGVFVREWTGAHVELNCTSFVATIRPKVNKAPRAK